MSLDALIDIDCNLVIILQREIKMSEPDLHLLIHKLCPFAVRALLVVSYKNLNIRMTECDLGEKPELLVEINPAGTVPALRVLKDNIEYDIG